MMIILNFFSCEGADPILDRASTVEKKPSIPAPETKSKPQSNKKPPVQKNKTTDLQKNIVAEVKLPQEEQLVLSGEIIVENWSGERIRVDVFDGDQQSLSGPRPSVVKVEYQNKPGPFNILVSKSEGELWIGGYVDEDGDGKPGPKDPSGWYEHNPVSATNDVNDIQLILKIPKDLEE